MWLNCPAHYHIAEHLCEGKSRESFIVHSGKKLKDLTIKPGKTDIGLSWSRLLALGVFGIVVHVID